MSFLRCKVLACLDGKAVLIAGGLRVRVSIKSRGILGDDDIPLGAGNQIARAVLVADGDRPFVDDLSADAGFDTAAPIRCGSSAVVHFVGTTDSKELLRHRKNGLARTGWHAVDIGDNVCADSLQSRLTLDLRGFGEEGVALLRAILVVDRNAVAAMIHIGKWVGRADSEKRVTAKLGIRCKEKENTGGGSCLSCLGFRVLQRWKKQFKISGRKTSASHWGKQKGCGVRKP